ncbi:MAG: GNAT family N-acetyltransferase [archaeon YNP-LCB-003-016]|uniref:GNAT family N-acetyltransferase n=1 Tax=Candidatus Culexarchaeum yellowstonense TaxID=2928963 RepID=UPI0026F29CA0|nr:GNAT family N-acetyltransferase [Candidatus Culexarchaeum yellowstonense]MCR6692451.1 GNAT family N-acetyltransferase [Candidatus Culexarchaeum yellowstonense]
MDVYLENKDVLEEADEEWYKSIVMANGKQNILLVACLNDKVVGFLHLYYGGGKGYIEAIAVKEEYRGAGIGGKLLNEAERILKRRGIIKVRLNVKHNNLKALAFYIRNGYSIDGVTMIMKWEPRGKTSTNGNVKLIKLTGDDLRKIDGLTSTWWSTVTERADREIYKYYRGEVAYGIYVEERFCGVVEFEPEETLYIDYLSVSHSNPQQALRNIIEGLKIYAMENDVREVIIPVDSTKKLFIQTMIEEGFRVSDVEYRFYKDLD